MHWVQFDPQALLPPRLHWTHSHLQFSAASSAFFLLSIFLAAESGHRGLPGAWPWALQVAQYHLVWGQLPLWYVFRQWLQASLSSWSPAVWLLSLSSGVGSVAASLRTLSEPVASLSSVPSSSLLFSWRWLHPGGGTIGSTWLSMVVPCASMPWGCGSSCPVGHVQPWCHGAPVWSTASLSFSVGVGATLGVSLKDPFPSVVPGPRVAPALVNDPDVVGGVHKGAGVESVWSVSALVSSFVVADRVPGGVGSLWLDAVCFLGGLPCTSL